MFGTLLSLFSRPPAADTPRRRIAVALPPSTIAAIEAATIIVRPGTREDGPSAIVQFAGRPGWRFDPQNAARVIGDGWPELTSAQVAQAVNRLSYRVNIASQEYAATADLAAPNAARQPFISRY